MTSTFWKPWGHRRKPAKCALALRGSQFLSILFFFFIPWSSASIGAGAGPGDGWALRKVCLISGPCDGVGGQAPKSEPLYRCLSPSDGWQRLLTGGNEESKRRAPGPRFQLNAVLVTSKRKKKCQISHRKCRLKRAGDVAAIPRGSSRLGREISRLGCLFGKTIKKADTVWETEAKFGVSRAQRFGGRNRRKWGQARLGPLPFALPWGS